MSRRNKRFSLPEQMLVRTEQLEQRRVLSAQPIEFSEIGYFLSESAASVNRYDIQNEEWLAPISLQGLSTLPTVMHVDSDGLYVASGSAVYRFAADGTQLEHLLNAPGTINDIETDGNLLFLFEAGRSRTTIVDKANNQLISQSDGFYSNADGFSIDPDRNRLFGRTSGVSPSDIFFLDYSDEGEITKRQDSRYHGDYPGAVETWVFPDAARVMDSSATVYSTDGVEYLTSLGAPVDDLVFMAGDFPVTLRGQEVQAYDAALLPTGSAQLEFPADQLLVNDTNVIAFRQQAGVWQTEILALADLDPPEPGEPVNPEGLAFTPDAEFIARDGIILLLSKQHLSVFEWDVYRQSFTGTIPLIGTPEHVAYSNEHHQVYVGYANGLIRKIDLNSAEREEVPFATLPQTPLGLETMGDYVFSVDHSGAWASHYTFDLGGTLVSSKDWNRYSREYIWSPLNQKLYFFRDGSSPNDIHAEEINVDGVTYPNLSPGEIGTTTDSPLHSSAGMQPPIHLSPDETLVLLGAGRIHRADNLEPLQIRIPVTHVDAVWDEQGVTTLREISGLSQLQKWTGETYELTDSVQFSEMPLQLLDLDQRQSLLVTQGSDGVPVFRVLDSELEVVPPPAGELDLQFSQETVIEGRDVTATVTRTGSLDEAQTIQFQFEHPSLVVDPSSVTIAAGQSLVSVNLTLRNSNSTVEEQTTRITVTADGLARSFARLNIISDEVVLIPSDGETIVSEDGQSDVVQIRLPFEPTADVFVNVNSYADQLGLNKSVLVFTPQNWNQVQTVAVSVDDNDLADGDRTAMIRLTVNKELSASEYSSSGIAIYPVSVLDDEPPRPVITSPDPQVFDVSPAIQWQPQEEFETYQVWLQRQGDDSFDPIVQDVTGTVFENYGTLPVGNYAVWVRGLMQDGRRSEWSLKNFSVHQSASFQSHPAYGSVDGPALDWADISGASGYEVWVNNVTTRQPGIIRDTSLATSAFQADEEFEFGLHRFWVRPLGPGGYRGPWSEPFDYYIGAQPDQFEMQTMERQPTFSWNAVQGASTYRLWIAGPGGFRLDQGELTSTEYTPSEELASGIYRWWVQAKTPEGWAGPWSQMSEMSVGRGPRTLQLVGESTDSTPILQWDSLQLADSYQVYVSAADQSGIIVNQNQVTDTQLQLPLLRDGQFYAWVRGANESGQTWWSSRYSFTVDASTVELQAHPVTPATATLESPVEFRWTKPTDASTVDLYITDGQEVLEQSGLTDTSWSTMDLSSGVWQWSVRARTADGRAGDWSETQTFDTSGRAIFLTRSGETTSSRPTVIWENVAGADRYDLYVLNLTTNQVLLREAELPDTTYRFESDLDTGQYRIWVKAISDSQQGPSVWSLPITLTIADAGDLLKEPFEFVAVLTSIPEVPSDQLMWKQSDLAVNSEAENESPRSFEKSETLEEVSGSATDSPQPLTDGNKAVRSMPSEELEADSATTDRLFLQWV